MIYNKNEKIIAYHIRFKQRFADTIKIGAGSTGHNEILGEIDATNQVHGANEGFLVLGINTGNYGLNEEGSESR